MFRIAVTAGSFFFGDFDDRSHVVSCLVSKS